MDIDPVTLVFFLTNVLPQGISAVRDFLKLKIDEEQTKSIMDTLNRIEAAQGRFDDRSDFEGIAREIMDEIKGNTENFNRFLSDFAEDRKLLKEIHEAVVEHPLPVSADREAFVDQVAQIYRITGCEVERDVSLGGETIDISAAFPMPLGVPRQIIYVRCVYGHKATIEEIMVFKNALLNNQRATGAVVSQLGFDPAALEFASQQGILTLTYDQLVSEIIDFSSYLDKRIADYDNQGVEYGIPLKRLYVDQDVIDDRTGKEFPLSDYVNDWLHDGSQNLLVILGDFGIGKTSYTLKFASELAQRRKLEKTGITPVRIELKCYREALKYETMIVNHLSDFGVSTTGYEAFDFLVSSGEVLLILDAFDEMAVQVNEAVTKKNLDELYKAVKGKAKVIITCRTHYFKEHPEVESLIYDIHAPEGFRSPGGTQLYRDISGRKNCKICFIQPFDDGKIGEYLENALADRREDALRMLRRDKGLKDLATRPVLLAMIAQSFDEISDKEGQIPSPAALYEVYIQKWIERDDARTNLTKKGKVEFAEALAGRLWIEDKDCIHYSELRPMVEKHFKSTLRVSEDVEYAENEVRTASFLTRDADGNYGFAHKSFMEFFLAQKFAREIESNQIVDFGRKEITDEVRDFLAAMVTDQSLLLGCISNKTPEEVGYAGANVVSVLRVMRDDDLSGADFSNCVVSHADFPIECSLAGADFSNAYMDAISLWLYGFWQICTSPDEKHIVIGGVVVSVAGGVIAILDSSDFSVVKEVEIRYSVNHIAYSPDQKYMVVSVAGGVIAILDSSDFSVVKEVKIRYSVNHIAYSPDEKHIVVGGVIGGVGGVTILDVSDFSVVREINIGYATNHISYSPDQRYIVVVGVVGGGGGVTILDASNFSVVKEVKIRYGVNHIAYSSDEKHIVVAGGGDITILDASDFSVVKEVKTRYGVNHIAYSPDGKHFVVAGGAGVGGVVGDITILDAFNFSVVKEVKTGYRVNHIAYSPDGKHFVVAGGNLYGIGRIAILDARSFDIVKEIVSVANDVRGMRIDGAKGLDPVLEDALRRAI